MRVDRDRERGGDRKRCERSLTFKEKWLIIMAFVDALDQRNLGCCAKFFAQLVARNPKAVVWEMEGAVARELKWGPQQVSPPADGGGFELLGESRHGGLVLPPVPPKGPVC